MTIIKREKEKGSSWDLVWVCCLLLVGWREVGVNQSLRKYGVVSTAHFN